MADERALIRRETTVQEHPDVIAPTLGIRFGLVDEDLNALQRPCALSDRLVINTPLYHWRLHLARHQRKGTCRAQRSRFALHVDFSLAVTTAMMQ